MTNQQTMKTIYTQAAILASVLFLTSFCSIVSAQWTNIGSSPERQIRLLSFPSESIGYAIMDDSGTAATKFYKSLNAGLTWTEVPWALGVFTSADIIDVHFPGNDVGYMAFRTFNPGLEALVYKSIDGGTNWSDVSPTNMNLGNGYMGVHFVNKDTGFVFSGNELYSTTDGGSSWQSDVFNFMGGPTEMDFNTNLHGVMGGWDGSFLYRGFIYTTTDGGVNWDTLSIPFSQSNISDVEMTDDNVAYALSGSGFGDGPTLFRSDDGGAKWDTISLSFLSDSLDMASDLLFVNASEGYMSTQGGYIYVTSDSGKTWQADHFEKPPLNLLAFNGRNVFSGGPVNTLLTKDLYGTTDEHYDGFGIRLYPNPVRDELNIMISQLNKDVLLNVHSIHGHLIYEEVITDQQIQLSVGEYLDGIYIITLTSDDFNLSKRFLVRH